MDCEFFEIVRKVFGSIYRIKLINVTQKTYQDEFTKFRTLNVSITHWKKVWQHRQYIEKWNILSRDSDKYNFNLNYLLRNEWYSRN